MAEKLCRGCGTVKPRDQFYQRHPNKVWITALCKVCSKANIVRLNESLRQEVRNAYGTVCQCCGEARPVFLAIDHIYGGGTKHAKTIGGGSRMYRWLKTNNFPSGFQVLCHNCNWAKHATKGHCPHHE